jgi:formate hydrogenlyase subunit 3/multisubunit Na+/H+ antiporter MnhD subunit
MSAPLIWILTPIAVGALLLILRRFRRAVWGAGTSVAFLLALAASILETEAVINLGPLSVKLESSYQILGRQFLLVDQDREVLILVFFLAWVVFLLTPLIEVGELLIPIGLIISGLIVASLSVDPFLYAALFIEMVVLFSVPLLVAPGKRVSKGALRFLSYESLGVPFLLYSDWMLAGSEGSPGDFERVLRAAILLGAGFAFLLAVFPFHSWLPMIFEEVHPYAAAFVAVFVLIVASLFSVELFNRFAWLRSSENFLLVLRIGGLTMLLIGGLWAAFSDHLGRGIGFGLMVFTGLLLLSLSLSLEPGLDYYFSFLRTSALAIMVWSSCLSVLASGRQGLTLSDLRGAGRILPLPAAGLVLACLILAGYPVLTGFAEIASLLGELSLASVAVAGIAAVGLTGIAAHGLRALWYLVSLDQDATDGSTIAAAKQDMLPGQQVLLLIGIVVMLLAGML